MTLTEYLKTLDADGKEVYARACGTSLGYLYLIAGGHRKASPGVNGNALKIAEQSGWLVTPHELRPDIYQDAVDGVPTELRAAFSDGQIKQRTAA